MEGVTDYYSKIVTCRSNLEDSNWLLGQISEQISELQNSTQRLKTTLEDCSRGCWENGGFGVGDLSFYTKGFLVGLIFDAEIRDLTHGEKSLDDVMRLLFERYRLPQPGLPEDGIQKAIAEVVGSGALDPLYERMLRSTQELPYDELRKLGLQLEVPGRPYTRPSYTASKGVVVQASGPALDAGLKAGDKLLSISDIAVGPDGQLPASQQFVVEREGAKVTLTIPVITAFADHLELIFDPAAGSEALKNRAAWLKRKS
jgi:predicted metalloprotease with PDZ domain